MLLFAAQRLLRVTRLLHGLVSENEHVRVQLLVQPADALEKGVHDFNRRQVVPADARQQLRRGHERELVVNLHLVTSLVTAASARSTRAATTSGPSDMIRRAGNREEPIATATAPALR